MTYDTVPISTDVLESLIQMADELGQSRDLSPYRENQIKKAERLWEDYRRGETKRVERITREAVVAAEAAARAKREEAELPEGWGVF